VNWELIHAELQAGRDLEPRATAWAMDQILSDAAPIEELKEFLLELKAKGESALEVSTLISGMYQHCAPIEISERAVDIVGTGGDGRNTINISTTAAIVTTAAGARVVKHGNRAATSKSGSADVLEHMGVNINLNGRQVAEVVRRIGIGFCHAPVFHSAMRYAIPARKALGVPTIFNILGPMANPAKPIAVAIGCARAEMLPLMAKVMAGRGNEGYIFRGDDGIDEISISDTTSVFQFVNGKISRHQFDPQELGIPKYEMSDLAGGDAAHNAMRTHEILAGQAGPAREAVLLNAAAAIAAFKADFSLSIDQQLANGYVLASQAIDSGKAARLLREWIQVSNAVATDPKFA
jgi:anthranilate phosphoribosyltransferase